MKVNEGERTRVGNFEGVCIARSNKGMGSNFTVRKMSFARRRRRIFTCYSPNIIRLPSSARAPCAVRNLLSAGPPGKSARIAERRDYRSEAGEG